MGMNVFRIITKELKLIAVFFLILCFFHQPEGKKQRILHNEQALVSV